MAVPIILSTGTLSGAGVAGQGRNDLQIGETVLLSDTQPLNTGFGYIWELEDVPIGSSTTLQNPMTATPHFVPDVTGSYRIRCLVNGTSESTEVLAVPLPMTGGRIPSFGEEGLVYDEGGNAKGWHEAISVFMREMDSRGLDSAGSINELTIPRQTLTTNTIYARSSGNDTTGDGTLGTPYATLQRAMQDVPREYDGVRYVVDITGITEAITAQYEFPRIHTPGQAALDLSKIGQFNQWSAPFTLYAEPTEIDSITLTGQSADSVTGLRTLTDTGQSWTTDEHVGRIALGSGFLQIGVIASNTATDLEVSSNLAFTNPVRILEPSAAIEFTDSFATFKSAAVLFQPFSEMVVAGVQFKMADNGSTNVGSWVYGASKMIFVGCWHEGMYTQSHVLSDACWFHDRSGNRKDHFVAGDEHRTRYCLFTNQQLRVYGAGARGTQGPFASIVDGCNSAGHGGNNESNSHYEITRCNIRNADAEGVLFMGGGRCSVRNTRIDDSGGNGVLVKGPGTLDLIDVTGTGNTLHGAHLEQGGCVTLSGTVDVTGTSGNVSLGGSGTVTWGSAPNNDLAAGTPQGCFLYDPP